MARVAAPRADPEPVGAPGDGVQSSHGSGVKPTTDRPRGRCGPAWPTGVARRGGDSVARVTILMAVHPQFLLHDTGPGHPERPARLDRGDGGRRGGRPARRDRPVRARPGRPGTHREGAPRSVPARPRGVHRRRRRPPRRRHGGERGLVRRRAAGRRRRSRRGRPARRRARPTRRSARCARRATTPRPRRPMGFCLFNNVAVAADGAGRPGRTGADRRLRRPSRQRHPGRLLRATPGSLYVSFHQYPLYPGTGALDEIGWGEGAGTTINFPFPPGATGDVYRLAIDEVLRAVRRAVAADVAAGLGRVRRPRSRSAHRARPHRRRLRRPHRGELRSWCRRGGASCSSRAATTSRRSRPAPARRSAALVGESTPTRAGDQRWARSARRRRRGPHAGRRSALTSGAAARAATGAGSLVARDPRPAAPRPRAHAPARRALRRGRAPAVPGRRRRPRPAARS